MRLTALATAAALVTPYPCYAEERIAFKEWILGGPSSSVEADARFRCRKPELATLGDMYCTLKVGDNPETIGGAPIERFIIRIYAGKVEAIDLKVKVRDFATVRQALSDKYGPGKVKEDTVQNRMGAKFENVEVTWDTPNGDRIRIEQRGRKLDESSISYNTAAGMKEFERRHESARKTKSGDL